MRCSGMQAFFFHLIAVATSSAPPALMPLAIEAAASVASPVAVAPHADCEASEAEETSIDQHMLLLQMRHELDAQSLDAESRPIDVAVLSDRPVGLAVVLKSTCRSTANPDALRFHIITRPETVANVTKVFHCLRPSCGDAALSVLDVATATQRLRDLGFCPFWASPECMGSRSDESGKTWGLKRSFRHQKHMDSLNHLRFYLPHLLQLDDSVNRMVFLDDDIVVQGDVRKLSTYTLAKGKAMGAGCQHWKHDGAWKMLLDVSMMQTGYLGRLDVTCKSEYDTDCVRSGLEQDLIELAKKVSPGSGSHANMISTRAFNMGLNVIDVAQWKDLGLTQKYEAWVRTNNEELLFPRDTLAFGLGLSYLAIGDAVQCYEDDGITHLVGLSFVPQSVLEDTYGWSAERMQKDAFALHFNGPQKPWDVSANVRCGDSDSQQPVSATQIWQRACGDEFCPCSKSQSVGSTASLVGAATATVPASQSPCALLLPQWHSSVTDSDALESLMQQGFHVSNEYVCTCTHGTAATGAHCTSDGDAVCGTCNSGYILEGNGTCKAPCPEGEFYSAGMTFGGCAAVTHGNRTIALPNEGDTEVVVPLPSGISNLRILMNSPNNDVDIHLCKSSDAYTAEDTQQNNKHVGCKHYQCNVGFTCTHSSAGQKDVDGVKMNFSGDNVGKKDSNGNFVPEWINVDGALKHDMVLDVHSYSSSGTGTDTATVQYSHDGITPCNHESQADTTLCRKCEDYKLYKGCPEGKIAKCHGTNKVDCEPVR